MNYSYFTPLIKSILHIGRRQHKHSLNNFHSKNAFTSYFADILIIEKNRVKSNKRDLFIEINYLQNALFARNIQSKESISLFFLNIEKKLVKKKRERIVTSKRSLSEEESNSIKDNSVELRNFP